MEILNRGVDVILQFDIGNLHHQLADDFQDLDLDVSIEANHAWGAELVA